MGNTRPHLEQTLGLIVTAVLLVSSFYMNRAETAIEHGDQKSFLRGTLITLILGVAFLIGVVGVEWQLAPFGPGDVIVERCRKQGQLWIWHEEDLRMAINGQLCREPLQIADHGLWTEILVSRESLHARYLPARLELDN